MSFPARVFPVLLAGCLAAVMARADHAPLTAKEQARLVVDGHPSIFGYSVALSGDTAVVGASQGSRGVVYVFVRNGSSWSEQAMLLPDGFLGGFGSSVAISGDTVLVGTPFEEALGSVYVFVRNGSSWSLQAKLTPSSGSAYSWFGDSVALDGDTAIVGAEYDDVGAEPRAGSAYVFARSGASWSEQARLHAPDERTGSRFGAAVAVSGDSALVGAPGLGAALLFARSGTSWSEQARLVPNDWEKVDRFGASVALSGDTAVVGAPGALRHGWKTGAVYVYLHTGLLWAQQAELFGSIPRPYGAFGHSVSLSHGALAVGELGTRAYVFLGGAASWSERAYLIPSNLQGEDNTFGNAIALSGNTVLVGAFQATIDPKTGWYEGAAYMFSLSFSPGVTVSPGAGLVTTEWGGAAPFLVVLDSQPDGGVVIDLASSDPGEGSVSPDQLFFTPADWSVPQVATLTGVDDFVKDDNQPYSAILGIDTELTADPVYAGVDPPDPAAVNLGLEGDFYLVTPCRVLDTPQQHVPLFNSVKYLVRLHAVCGVPATAGAVAITWSVVRQTSPGILLIGPGDLAPPNVSSFVFQMGVTAGHAIVPLATDRSGTLAIWPRLAELASVDLVIDVSGYFE